MHMKGEWCYFKNYFKKDFCDEIIENALTVEPQDGIINYSDGGPERADVSSRRCKVRFLTPSDWKFSRLFDELWKTQIVANKDFFNVHVSKLDFVQFTEYDESYMGEYKDHQDVIWLNDTQYHRKLSCVINLSESNSYEGGDLEMIDVANQPHYPDIRTQGTIFYFLPFYYHRVTPVIRGKRYSLVAWFEGPKWR